MCRDVCVRGTNSMMPYGLAREGEGGERRKGVTSGIT